MKDCLICLADAQEDSLLTCPFCGEASWTESARAAADESPAPEQVSDADASPASLRRPGRKGSGK